MLAHAHHRHWALPRHYLGYAHRYGRHTPFVGVHAHYHAGAHHAALLRSFLLGASSVDRSKREQCRRDYCGCFPHDA
jgi:hypothetical protein